jgi:hypothetical protein
MLVRADTVLFRRLPSNVQSLRSLIAEYNDVVTGAGADETGLLRSGIPGRSRSEDLAMSLNTLLIDPLESWMKGLATLYVRLPEEFGWLPLQTLTRMENSQKVALVQRFQVNYLPMAAALAFQPLPDRPAFRVIGFGHRGSTQWDVEYELMDIRSFYEKALMLFDTLATFERLRHMNYDILAIAAEFRIDTTYPERSVCLASEGRSAELFYKYPVGELAGMPVPQTIMMSDISTSPGILARYLPLIFLANGSRNVIVTMWRGDRRAKRYFGEVFYTASFAGSTGQEAYQRAEVATSTNKDFSAPARWGLYFRFGK